MTTKPKVKKRAHNRKRIPQLDDKGVLERRNAAVIAFDRAFRAKLPQHEASGQNAMSSGNYVQAEGDQYDGKEYPIADGRYRVAGSDWIFDFEGGGFVEAMHAEPPDYGGDKVIAITA